MLYMISDVFVLVLVFCIVIIIWLEINVGPILFVLGMFTHHHYLYTWYTYGLDHKTVDGSLDRVAGQFKQFKVWKSQMHKTPS